MTAESKSFNGDDSLLDLFKIEVETHSGAIETGLVAVESSADPGKLEALMRAAHSIKGAARIVGLEHGVGLAHAMEDILTAAQETPDILSAPVVDCLLKANDLFKKLIACAPGDIPAEMDKDAEQIAALEKELRAFLENPPSIVSPAAAGERSSPQVDKNESEDNEPAPPEPVEAIDDQGFVRVHSRALTGLMGLSGEMLVHSKACSGVCDRFLRMLSDYSDMESMLEDISRRVLAGMSAEQGAMLLADVSSRCRSLSRDLSGMWTEIERFANRSERLAERVYDQTVATRMRPFSDGLHGFPRIVRDLSRRLDKNVRLDITGAETRVDRDILEKLEAPLTHLVQNAMDHGIESPADRRQAGKSEEGVISMQARHCSGLLQIEVSDDGSGIDVGALRKKIVDRGHSTAELVGKMSDAEVLEFLFLPGFSTTGQLTDLSGRGVGLDVVQSMVREVQGSVRIETKIGTGTSFVLQLPLTLSVLRSLVVDIDGEAYALPLSRIDRLLCLDLDDLSSVEDRQFCEIDGECVGILDSFQILGIGNIRKSSGPVSIVVISDRLKRYGMIVDCFRAQADLVVRPLDSILGKTPCVGAGAVLDDGSTVLILETDDLVRAIDNILTQGKVARVESSGESSVRRKHVLVVDDSLTVREAERKLLENRGYAVSVAVDGKDGLDMLKSGRFDIVVSDIDMPRMNGIELVSTIRNTPGISSVPIVIVSYKEREEDRRRGLEAGADRYLTKSSFHDETLVEAVRDMVGEGNVPPGGDIVGKTGEDLT